MSDLANFDIDLREKFIKVHQAEIEKKKGLLQVKILEE